MEGQERKRLLRSSHYYLYKLKEGVAKLYDSRSGEEAEIKEDKKGLDLERRRKRNFQGQEALILLAQLAHNILIWAKEWFFWGMKIAGFGIVRLREKVLKLPGEVEIKGKRLKKFFLKESHPFAAAVLAGARQVLGEGRPPPRHPFEALKVVWGGALKWIGR
jgi:hypothetical protein